MLTENGLLDKTQKYLTSRMISVDNLDKIFKKIDKALYPHRKVALFAEVHIFFAFFNCILQVTLKL